jgi:hypothetical protein
MGKQGRADGHYVQLPCCSLIEWVNITSVVYRSRGKRGMICGRGDHEAHP